MTRRLCVQPDSSAPRNDLTSIRHRAARLISSVERPPRVRSLRSVSPICALGRDDEASAAYKRALELTRPDRSSGFLERCLADLPRAPE
jgi:hypothetical protein